VIREYVALLDPARVGLGLLAYVNVKLEKRGQMPIDEFRRVVEGWPEVVACYSMTGDMDYLLRVQVEDLDHYNRFMMERLLKQAGVIDVKSNFVLERIKDTTALPLGHLGSEAGRG
jgi:Lrp/AsnC family leucine-responsive transcriptional regulator